MVLIDDEQVWKEYVLLHGFHLYKIHFMWMKSQVIVTCEYPPFNHKPWVPEIFFGEWKKGMFALILIEETCLKCDN